MKVRELIDALQALPEEDWDREVCTHHYMDTQEGCEPDEVGYYDEVEDLMPMDTGSRYPERYGKDKTTRILVL